jgi:hypothetical protein
MSTPAAAALATAKVAALVVAGAALGGVAVVASNGALPNPLVVTHAGRTTPASPGRPSPADHGSHGHPSPSLVGLCHAYTAGVAQSPGKALDSPAFDALISAAGGRDQVSAYCAKVLASVPGNAPTANPGRHPPGRPGGAPGTRHD